MVDEDAIVTCTIRKFTDAIAEALKVVSYKKPDFKVGDKIMIEATITGFNKSAVNVVFDNVPDHFHRSYSYNAAVLAAAVKAA